MLFNSYIFLFLFLPLALAGWYLLNRFRQYKLAQGYLIGMSLWFYAYYNVSFLWVITGSCLFNYGISFLLHRKKYAADAEDSPGRWMHREPGCIGLFQVLQFLPGKYQFPFPRRFSAEKYPASPGDQLFYLSAAVLSH